MSSTQPRHGAVGGGGVDALAGFGSACALGANAIANAIVVVSTNANTSSRRTPKRNAPIAACNQAVEPRTSAARYIAEAV
jgi:hypothetical protein